MTKWIITSKSYPRRSCRAGKPPIHAFLSVVGREPGATPTARRLRKCSDTLVSKALRYNGGDNAPTTNYHSVIRNYVDPLQEEKMICSKYSSHWPLQKIHCTPNVLTTSKRKRALTNQAKADAEEDVANVNTHTGCRSNCRKLANRHIFNISSVRKCERTTMNTNIDSQPVQNNRQPIVLRHRIRNIHASGQKTFRNVPKLLEGLQSSLVISKIPSISHERKSSKGGSSSRGSGFTAPVFEKDDPRTHSPAKQATYGFVLPSLMVHCRILMCMEAVRSAIPSKCHTLYALISNRGLKAFNSSYLLMKGISLYNISISPWPDDALEHLPQRFLSLNVAIRAAREYGRLYLG
ncbi:hypothetical protein IEQ34_013924 [Dendrobium chrysotoxum]|uniref:Uncharacterized protein n=1 Tax=Dendrobium chrysotoxum TaxID=161865 RepID=A0AAV7GKN3_DENCH|nr:hypothetical protein IEQ34_013924 [Dendrobium chrysotoxum]